MGEEIEQQNFETQDFERFDQRLRQETEFVRELFASKRFDNKTRKLGYELELCLLDKNGQPSSTNLDVIDRSDNPLFTTELAKFNLEINGNPCAISEDAIDFIDNDLKQLYAQAEAAAGKLDARCGLFGVLPNLTREHLISNVNMTGLHRYNLLSKQLIQMRGRPVKLHLKGQDELVIEQNDVMLECMATSLQVHLQCPFDEIVPAYNAALWSSMLILGAVPNSPLILGKRCWQESRVSIFKQAVDTRNPQEIADRIIPRVHFGKGYIDSMMDIFDDNFYYSPILPEVIDKPIEKLHHFSLHNGTIWRWVRPILGVDADNGYHLRLELRVVPSGPTIIDTIANLAFYVGLTEGLKASADALTQVDFKKLEADFYRAAREGMQAQVHWIDGSQHRLKDLLLEKALEVAAQGLDKLGIGHYQNWLEIIRARVETEQTGAAWILQHWNKHGDSDLLVQHYLQQAGENRPVHLWKKS